MMTTTTPPPVQIKVESIDTATELGAYGAGFILTRDGNFDERLRVHYQVDATSTAEPGVDFEPLPGFIDFTPGEPKAFIPLTPRRDYVCEWTEYVVLRLVDGPGYVRHPTRGLGGLVQIVDLDKCRIELEAEFLLVGELHWAKLHVPEEIKVGAKVSLEADPALVNVWDSPERGRLLIGERVSSRDWTVGEDTPPLVVWVEPLHATDLDDILIRLNVNDADAPFPEAVYRVLGWKLP